MKAFADLTEREILALAISSEEDDSRTYMAFAHELMDRFPASAKVFIEMAEEEQAHKRSLTDAHQKKFGDFIPLIRRSDVRGFVQHTPVWLSKQMTLDAMRQRAEVLELENMRFYRKAAEQASDPAIAKLLNDLAEAEKDHTSLADRLGLKHLTPDARLEEA